MDLELHPLGKTGGLGKPGKPDGLLGGVGPAGVGEEEVFRRVDELEDVGKGISLAAQIGPTERHGDDLRAAGRQGLAHHLAGGEFPGSQEEPRGKLTAGNDQGRSGGHPVMLSVNRRCLQETPEYPDRAEMMFRAEARSGF